MTEQTTVKLLLLLGNKDGFFHMAIICEMAHIRNCKRNFAGMYPQYIRPLPLNDRHTNCKRHMVVFFLLAVDKQIHPQGKYTVSLVAEVAAEKSQFWADSFLFFKKTTPT